MRVISLGDSINKCLEGTENVTKMPFNVMNYSLLSASTGLALATFTD
jgi:hypothetical protein